LDNIKSKITKGFLWAGLGSFGGRGIQFASDVLLSKLLIPEDFGLMAIGLAVLNISEMLTETGFNSALIQKQGNIKKYLNTAWTMELIKSFFLFILIFLLADPISKFYDEKSVGDVIKGISLLFLLRGLRNVGIIYFRKNLQIHKQVALDIFPSIIQLIVVIPTAQYLQNVWAIIFSVAARRTSELILSFIMHHYRPRFEFKLLLFKELFQFGKWIFSLSIISAIRKNFVPLFIGKYFGVVILGYFNRAELLSILFFSVLNEVTWKVGYPTMSHLQSNKNKLKKFYLDLFFIIIYLAIPISGSIYLFNQELVTIIFSHKWLPSASMLKLLIFAGLISFSGTLSSMLMQSIGKPKVATKISFNSIMILLATIFPLSYFMGIRGLIFSLIITNSYSMLHSLFFVMKVMEIKIVKIFYPILFSVINAIFFFLPILFLKLYLFSSHNMITLCFFTAFGIVLFIFLAIIWKKIFTFNIIDIIIPHLFKKK
tara:strand:+ start:437 stop:1891 length:1455 start_codon:yes stop_codon:yes gene_type:complete